MKKMHLGLGISLTTNVILVTLCLFLFSRTIWGVRLRWRISAQRPDLEKVERQVKAVLSRPEFADWYTLKELKKGQWIATFQVTHRPDPSGKLAWEKLELLQSQIAKETGLPCWPKGWVSDPTNAALNIGEYCVVGNGVLEPGFK